MPLILEIKNIAKKFGKIVALRDIDFKINEGEFVYITGSSGAGKTTLLKCILRQILPDGGEIILEGEDIAKLPRKKIPYLRQKIGVVFQDFKVLPERTVRENVEVALAVVGLSQSEWDVRVDHVLRLVGLIERSELFPSQLSGGELQRVSLARALIVNPKIILADEPTGNLDWETADKIMELFNLINKEGKTIVMATHNKEMIQRHKKRVIELKDGIVFKDAQPENADLQSELVQLSRNEEIAGKNRQEVAQDIEDKVESEPSEKALIQDGNFVVPPHEDVPPMNLPEEKLNSEKETVEYTVTKHAKKKKRKNKLNDKVQ